LASTEHLEVLGEKEEVEGEDGEDEVGKEEVEGEDGEDEVVEDV
jgi:hypothetical protein